MQFQNFKRMKLIGEALGGLSHFTESTVTEIQEAMSFLETVLGWPTNNTEVIREAIVTKAASLKSAVTTCDMGSPTCQELARAQLAFERAAEKLGTQGLVTTG